MMLNSMEENLRVNRELDGCYFRIIRDGVGQTEKSDILIILGDAGINYYGIERDAE